MRSSLRLQCSLHSSTSCTPHCFLPCAVAVLPSAPLRAAVYLPGGSSIICTRSTDSLPSEILDSSCCIGHPILLSFSKQSFRGVHLGNSCCRSIPPLPPRVEDWRIAPANANGHDQQRIDQMTRTTTKKHSLHVVTVLSYNTRAVANYRYNIYAAPLKTDTLIN